MEKLTTQQAAKQDFLPLMRALVRAYQAFSSFDAAGLRKSGHGLTTSQADVIFTLGNTEGMMCSEITDKTLITKGTLTGVIDRLRAKGLVERWEDAYDGRRTIIALTAAGEQVFESLFPRQVALLKARFDRLDDSEKQAAIRMLGKIKEVFG